MVLGFRVWRDYDVSICLRDHVIVDLEWVRRFIPWYKELREFWFNPPSPFFIMSLSDQHPYALFVSGGLRSPSLAKARVEVGDNADAYLASTDVVTFVG